MRPHHLSILIPARNEEDLLPACLASIHAALSHLTATETGVSTDVVLVVDSSTDQTWNIASAALRRTGVVVRSSAGVVGEARALAASTALARYRGPRHSCWLANTDADCIVPADWLTTQISIASTGVDVIAGTIDVVDFCEHDSVVEDRFRRTYPIAPDGSHPHVHGANLGIRADAYLQAGGWHDLVTGEDHDLWRRLASTSARRTSVNQTRVITSGRRVGRAPWALLMHWLPTMRTLLDPAAASVPISRGSRRVAASSGRRRDGSSPFQIDADRARKPWLGSFSGSSFRRCGDPQ